jgi:diadenosine tetraphosphate (Ap4A) HIT family hydrolase
VTLDHLWAGWRSQYVVAAGSAQSGERPSGPGDSTGDPPDDPAHCVFCRIAASGPPSAENGVLWVGPLTFAVLNAYPYASGHLLVLPIRHVEEMDNLSDAESDELWATTRTALRALRRAYAPEGINLGANLGRAAGAGIPRHLHLHVVPRWSGDTNFMTSVAGVRVLPESLPVAWEKLHGAWPS